MSTEATRLILVRHGQTACNVAEIWHGWDDCDLTEVGMAQARAAGARLAGEPIGAIYSSDSPRAMQTAAAIAEPHGLEPIPTPDLRERHAGVFEGLRLEEVTARHPDVWERRNADFWGWAPPEGETFQQLLDRALRAVREIVARHPGETVVAVSHMSTVRSLISHLAGIPVLETFTMEFPSTGVSILEIEGDRVTVERLNDGTHVVA